MQEATLPMKVRMCGDAFMPVVGGRWTMVCRHLPDGRWSDEEERLSSCAGSGRCTTRLHAPDAASNAGEGAHAGKGE